MGKSILNLEVAFMTPNDVIIPPFSSKASKFIMHKLSTLYGELAKATGLFKPFSISPILHNGRALMNLGGGGISFSGLGSGTTLGPPS